MLTLKVVNPGLFTTIQDQGRPGWQEFGIPPAGAVDQFAYRAANALVGNQPGAAALEFTLVGPVLHVLSGGIIAVTGADMEATLNGRPLPLWTTVPVTAGDIIAFGCARSGCRTYLAAAGGFAVTPVLGSCSTFVRGQMGGIQGRALQKGDILQGGPPTRSPSELWGRSLPPAYRPCYITPWILRVVLGPQDNCFTPGGIATFLNSTYTVSHELDRMGCRLQGPPLEHIKGADIISEGIPAGAVQVPGNGQPIIMLTDRQTTGGYTKIAVVITADLWRIAQAKPGDEVRFQAVTVTEAQAIYRRYQEMLQALPRAIEQQQQQQQRYIIKVQTEAKAQKVHSFLVQVELV